MKIKKIIEISASLSFKNIEKIILSFFNINVFSLMISIYLCLILGSKTAYAISIIIFIDKITIAVINIEA